MASPSMDSAAAAKLLSNVALQSFGSKAREAEKGGFGSIGMIGGRVVKFNTHWKESLHKTTPEMLQSSNALRMSLGAAAKTLIGNTEALKPIFAKLGLDAEGNLVKGKSLLSRTVAASVLKMIDEKRGGNSFSEIKNYDHEKLQALSTKNQDTRASFINEYARACGLYRLTPQATLDPKLLLKDKVSFINIMRNTTIDSSNYELETDGEMSQKLKERYVKGEIDPGWTEYDNDLINTMCGHLDGLEERQRVDAFALALALGPTKLLKIIGENRKIDQNGQVERPPIKYVGKGNGWLDNEGCDNLSRLITDIRNVEYDKEITVDMLEKAINKQWKTQEEKDDIEKLRAWNLFPKTSSNQNVDNNATAAQTLKK